VAGSEACAGAYEWCAGGEEAGSAVVMAPSVYVARLIDVGYTHEEAEAAFAALDAEELPGGTI